MKKLSLIITFLLLASLAYAQPNSVTSHKRIEPGYEDVILVSSNICAEVTCSENGECSNSCDCYEWRVKESELKPKTPNNDFPVCEIDGCGNCPYVLKAQGYQSYPYFKVVKWSKADKGSIIGKAQKGSTGLTMRAVSDSEDRAYSIEEMKEAVQASYKVWDTVKLQHTNSYVYETNQTWADREFYKNLGYSTTVGVKNGVIQNRKVRRYPDLEYMDSSIKNGSEKGYFVESITEINSHKQGDRAKTMEMLYEGCLSDLSEVAPKPYSDFSIVLTEDKLLKHCGGCNVDGDKIYCSQGYFSIGNFYWDRFDPPSDTTGFMQVVGLRIASYMKTHNKVPPNLDILPRLDGYENRITDAWNNKIIYFLDKDEVINLVSYGRDGKKGGKYMDEDIVMQYGTKTEEGNFGFCDYSWSNCPQEPKERIYISNPPPPILKEPSSPEAYTAVSFKDARTIVVKGKEGEEQEVVLIGLDNPGADPNEEYKKDNELQGVNPMQGWGDISSRLKMLRYRGVLLEFDEKKRDKDGRLLAYVYRKQEESDYHDKDIPYNRIPTITKNGAKYELANATLIASGLAAPVRVPPNLKYADLFRELYVNAVKEQKFRSGGYQELFLTANPSGTSYGFEAEDPCKDTNWSHYGAWSVIGALDHGPFTVEPTALVTNLPICDLDNCGKCPYILKAYGFRTSFKFYIEKWTKENPNSKDIINRIKVQEEAGGWNLNALPKYEAKKESELKIDAAKAHSNNEELVLSPFGVCTERACHPKEPCCNKCQFEAWFTQGVNEDRLKAVSLNEKLPSCKLNGCGKCPFTLKAHGYRSFPYFKVQKWSKEEEILTETKYKSYSQKQKWVQVKMNTVARQGNDPYANRAYTIEELKEAVRMSYKIWNEKKRNHSNSYSYRIETPQQGVLGPILTDVTVRNGLIRKRELYGGYYAAETFSVVEEGNKINSDKRGARAKTMETLYENCLNDLSEANLDEYPDIKIALSEEKLLIECGGCKVGSNKKTCSKNYFRIHMGGGSFYWN